MSSALERFQYHIDIERDDRLYGMSGKTLYYGRWISKHSKQVLIVEMNETIAKHEGFFYKLLNDHPHVIRTFGYVENPLNMTIFVQEFAPYGDLANLLFDDRRELTEALLIEMFRQTANAMSYLAKKSVVHGDLGCRNILVYQFDSKNVKNTLVKITDFGLARSLNNPTCVTADPSVIPVRYCAPEILQRNDLSSYSEKSDVYSMGVAMWEALSKSEMPYSSISTDEEVKSEKLKGVTLPKPEMCNPLLWRLIQKCWAPDRNQRITFEQMEHALARINLDETATTPQRMISDRMFDVTEFRLDTDIRLKGSFSQSRQLFEMDWVSRRERRSVLIRLHRLPTEQEIYFYDRSLSHNNLVMTFGYVRYDLLTYMIVQERSAHGNLRHVLAEQHFQPNLPVLIELFFQMIEVMRYLVSNHAVHGDLRCDNILVFQMHPTEPKNNLIKLTNFQSVQSIAESARIERRSNISIRHCAPEILRSAGQGGYSEMSEVYSFGVVMWEICSSGQQPYHTSVLDAEVRQKKLNGEKLARPNTCNPILWSIIEDCWHNEPCLRFNFSDMKIRLRKVPLNTAPPAGNMTQHPYALNVDVRKGPLISGRMGKQLYAAEWIRPQQPNILILAMDETTARQELSFYLEFQSHPNIVRTFGRVQCHDPLTNIIQERAQHGDLESFLQQSRSTFSNEILLEIVLQVLHAMCALTAKKIIHGDLRCANVLVCQLDPNRISDISVKLTNFHQAFRQDQANFTRRDPNTIPVRYCAVELLRDTSPSTYSEYSEVYSMGILMWQVFSKGAAPFGLDLNDQTIRERRLNDQALTKPQDCPTPIWALIEPCFLREPALRFCFQEIQRQLIRIRDRLSSPSARIMPQRGHSFSSPHPPERRLRLRETLSNNPSSTDANSSTHPKVTLGFLSSLRNRPDVPRAPEKDKNNSFIEE